MSRWQDTYRKLRDIERLWPVPRGGPEHQVFRHAISSSSQRYSLEFLQAEARALRVKPPRGFWEAVSAVRPDLDIEEAGNDPEDPYEDVYQAAVSLTVASHVVPFWQSSPEYAQVFRGSNNHEYAVVPWIFRDRSEDESQQAWKRLAILVARLRVARPELSEEQAVALVQHYKSEAGVGTWLIDVTWDLRVALFFASFAGKSGKLGTVQTLRRGEWERLSAGGRNRLGPVRLIEVPSVHRIRAQRALFLDTSHPELFEQYVAFSRWFRQRDGLVFEDVAGELEAPVSEEALLPTKDASLDLILSILPDLSSLNEAAPLATAPTTRADHPLGAADYLQIALSWAEARGWTFDQATEEIVPKVCAVHAALQQHRDKIDLAYRSLHNLERAVEYFALNGTQQLGPNTLQDALELFYYGGESSKTKLFKAIIAEIERN